MTIIVYRDGILASDTLITDPDTNSRQGYSKKIIKAKDGALAGASGDAEYCCDFLEWAKTDRATPPPKDKTKGYNSAILILPNGEIHSYYGQKHDIMMDKWIAIGAGQFVAQGALYMGATAREAVKAAIKYNTLCGGKVLTLKLGSDIKKK